MHFNNFRLPHELQVGNLFFRKLVLIDLSEEDVGSRFDVLSLGCDHFDLLELQSVLACQVFEVLSVLDIDLFKDLLKILTFGSLHVSFKLCMLVLAKLFEEFSQLTGLRLCVFTL